MVSVTETEYLQIFGDSLIFETPDCKTEKELGR